MRSGLGIALVHDISRLAYLAVYDGSDLFRLTTAERLALRVLEGQGAIKRQPRAPTFKGLEVYMRHAAATGGYVHAPDFNAHVSATFTRVTIQKEEGKVMANQRPQDEEASEAAPNCRAS